MKIAHKELKKIIKEEIESLNEVETNSKLRSALNKLKPYSTQFYEELEEKYKSGTVNYMELVKLAEYMFHVCGLAEDQVQLACRLIIKSYQQRA